MAIFDDDDTLPGLLPASFRGVKFHVPDASHEVGRRIVATWFPGLDDAHHEDLGRLDGLISIRGLIVGDDYIAEGKALQAALQAAGPGTLVHPWLGMKTVVVPEPATISFSDVELRVCRFEAVFALDGGAGLAPIVSTLASLLSAVTSLATAGGGTIESALAAPNLSAGARGAGLARAEAAASAVVSAAGESRGSARLGASLAPLAGGVTAAAAIADRGKAAAATAEAVRAVVAAVVGEAAGGDTPAIAPGGTALARVPALTARAGASVLLSAAASIAALAVPSTTVRAVGLGGEAMALAGAVKVAAEIEFESRQDAEDWRARLDDVLAGLAGRTAELAPAMPDRAARTWRAVAELRAAVAVDLNEVVGRLPSVVTVKSRPGASAWLVAQHFAGDDPSTVKGVLDDVVRRNRLRHPALLPAGTLEVLPP